MMKTLLRALALTFLLSIPALASNLPGPFSDASIGATSCTAACDTIVVFTNGTGAAHFSVTGSGTGLSYIFQGFNGTNWATAPYCSTNAYPPTCDVAALTAQTGEYSVPVHGFQKVRLHLTAIGGGTLTGSADAGAGSAVVLIAGAVSASGSFTCSACALETGGNLAIIAGGYGSLGSAPPSKSVYLGASASGNLTGLVTCDSHVFKHITSATDTVAVQGVSAKTIKVCGALIAFSGSAAQSIFLENTASTNNNCSSTLTQITGLLTGNSSSPLPVGFYNPIWGGLANTSGNGLCINSSGTGGADIDIWYTQGS